MLVCADSVEVQPGDPRDGVVTWNQQQQHTNAPAHIQTNSKWGVTWTRSWARGVVQGGEGHSGEVVGADGGKPERRILSIGFPGVAVEFLVETFSKLSEMI